MKFSIASIGLLMVLIALVLAVLRSRIELTLMQAKTAQYEAETASMQAEIANMIAFSDPEGTEKADLQRERDELARLHELLAKGFERHREQMSRLEFQVDRFCIRSIPVLEEPDVLRVETKVFIPENRPVALEVQISTQAEQLSELRAGPDFQGPEQFRHALSTGEHLISACYDERGGSPLFTLRLDGIQLKSWNVIDSKDKGYSLSTKSWIESTSYKREQRLPRLLKLSPASGQVFVAVSLVEAPNGQ